VPRRHPIAHWEQPEFLSTLLPVKELFRRNESLAGIVLAIAAAILAYPTWLFLDALARFMEPPPRNANIGLLLLVFVPLVAICAGICWKIVKPGQNFFWGLGVTSALAVMVMAAVHQSEISKSWEQTPQGKQEHDTRRVSAAYQELLRPRAIEKLRPPLDFYEVQALAMRMQDQRLDAATLHHVFVTFPKQVDCEIAKNPNALSEDLVAIWNEHICADEHTFVMNPNVPLKIVRSIFDAHHGKTSDWHAAMVRDEAALRLAKGSCDPELLYSFFTATDEFPPETQVGGLLRMYMARNMCLPEIVCAQMQSPPESKQAACDGHDRGVARWDPKVREAQAWRPQRVSSGQERRSLPQEIIKLSSSSEKSLPDILAPGS
jgi:hypothetical protein